MVVIAQNIKAKQVLDRFKEIRSEMSDKSAKDKKDFKFLKEKYSFLHIIDTEKMTLEDYQELDRWYEIHHPEYWQMWIDDIEDRKRQAELEAQAIAEEMLYPVIAYDESEGWDRARSRGHRADMRSSKRSSNSSSLSSKQWIKLAFACLGVLVVGFFIYSAIKKGREAIKTR